jgi:hypothetical protein
MTTAQLVPHDLEAERGVLGAMLRGEHVAELATRAPAGDFYSPAHAVLHDTITALAEQGVQFDPLIVSNELSGIGKDALTTGDLIAMMADAPMSATALEYAQLVHQKAQQRHALRALLEGAKSVREGRLDVVPTVVQQLLEVSAEHGLSSLLIEDASTVAARVRSMPKAKYLARPVWPSDAYGVMAAAQKSCKTWLALDLVVSVASGGAWIGTYPVETPGPVLVFLGEGGERKMVRRLQAICEAKKVELDDLPIRLCHRAPTLTNAAHLEDVRREVRQHHPVLVVVDPLYLSAAGAKSADLYAMGQVLSGIQSLCQENGAALVIVTHWNKTGEGHGAHRMTGAGPAEWGRVLVSASVEHRATNADRSTDSTLRLTFEGDELPETELRLRLHVGADDPDDLSSALHYGAEVLPGVAVQNGTAGLRPADRRVLAVLTEADDWLDVVEIGDLLAKDDSGFAPLKRRTIWASLKTLAAAGSVRSSELGSAHKWRAQVPENEAENVA